MERVFIFLVFFATILGARGVEVTRIEEEPGLSVVQNYLHAEMQQMADYGLVDIGLISDFNDTGPFQLELAGDVLQLMIERSLQDTNEILRPCQPYHRFVFKRNVTDYYRVHCRNMAHFINTSNLEWTKSMRKATNLFAYHLPRYDPQGPQMDRVCYLVDAKDQRESQCLLKVVKANGTFPWIEHLEHCNREIEDYVRDHLRGHHVAYHTQDELLTGRYCHLVNFDIFTETLQVINDMPIWIWPILLAISIFLLVAIVYIGYLLYRSRRYSKDGRVYLIFQNRSPNESLMDMVI